MRGGSRSQAKPRKKAPASRPRSQVKATRAYAPAKLRAAQGVGLAPHHALLAASGILVVALAVALGTGHRSERLVQGVEDMMGRGFAGMGFTLNHIHVEGASKMAAADIEKAVEPYRNQPLLGLDLEAVRARVAKVGWVKEARVVRLLPDTLVLAVVERRELAVWQHEGRSRVIDEHGQVIPEADPSRFPALPLIVGAGANENAAQILQVVDRRPRLKDRLEAVVRVDDRRWDLRLKDGSLVQLPSSGEEAALIQLEQLDRRSRILELGFERIDLRDPTIVSVRPRGGAVTPPGQLVADGA